MSRRNHEAKIVKALADARSIDANMAPLVHKGDLVTIVTLGTPAGGVARRYDGATGVVVGVGTKRAQVHLDDGYLRRKYGAVLTVPAGQLELS